MGDIAFVFAQSADVPWNQARILAAITAVCLIFVAWRGAGIVKDAKNQQTSDALGVGGRILLGCAILGGGAGLIALGAQFVHWAAPG